MKRGFWWVLAGIVVVIALAIALIAIFGGGSGPRGYVAGHYHRASSLDIRGDSDNKAYTSPKPVPVVAREITSRWRPQSQQTDASGVYLRYSDDAVIIQPRAAGSVIHVMDVDRAYRHYHSHVSHGWGGLGTRGETFRGGGPGTGK
ncbi:DUF4247 domain-containing protein [Saccharopolyspora sp. NFXS83]|uniref:DUF4247 domain-containing protein n=1 Tax=Saccharopolyspora sp. NFXS83 TaxID=2993560 RepID=UPI00224B12DE|nr:DUF4247 domain-containing protein [Saccharopolyspora sp. NFXS83]MCX2733693.1 DUF4247 domain-containing protein [Saccharopolyspora sp. NFXS83]